jgi:hypothetical protein
MRVSQGSQWGITLTRMKTRVIKHEVVPDCGSYEVRFPDGRPSKYFYLENLPRRRLRPDRVEQAVGNRMPKRFAREEQNGAVSCPYP